MRTSRFGYAPALIIPRVAALGAVLVLTRILSPSEFGLYALVIVYGELLDSVALSWSRLGLQRFYHLLDADLTDLRKKAVLTSVVGACIGVVLAFLLAFGSAVTSSWSFYGILLVYFLGVGILRHALNILRAQERVLPYLLIECFRSVLGFLLAWFLAVQWGATFVPASIGTFGVSALFALGALALIGRETTKGDRRISLKDFLRYSVPLAGVFLVSQIAIASDRYLLSEYGGAALVGVYAACTSIARPPLETLFNIVNTAAFPRLVKTYEQYGQGAAAKELGEHLGVLVLIGLPALVGLWLVAKPLSELLLDVRYQENADWIIRLASLAALFVNLKSFFSDQVFHLRKASVLQTATLIPGAIFTVIGCLYAIPAYGGLGAAWALVVGNAISALLSFVLAQRRIPVTIPWPLVGRALLGCAAMVAIARFLSASGSLLMLAATIIVCAAAYALVCSLTGVTQILKRGAA